MLKRLTSAAPMKRALRPTRVVSIAITAGDFHLKAGSAAINRGDPKAYPLLDRAKRRRAIGSAPDTGAFEFRL